MTKFMTTTEKAVVGIILAAILFVLLALFSPVGSAWATNGNGGGHTPITVCHKPGTPAEKQLTFDDNALGIIQMFGHLGHGDTLGACPEPPPFDQCPDIEGNQEEGTDCTPEPPYDACPEIEGNQEEGYDCNPEPPFDACPNIEGNQEQGTNCNPTPPGPRCPPGMFPTNGKDGEEGNDECEYPQTPTTPETPETPPVTPPATPEPPVSPESPPSSAPAAPAAPGVEETPTFQEELEKQAEKQAKANGATPTASPDAQAADALPYTGLPLGLVALLGGALSGAGLWLRRRP